MRRTKLKFNKVVARAFNRVNYILNLVDDLLIDNGLVILGKGENLEKEINFIENKNFTLYEKIKNSFRLYCYI